MPCSRSTSDSAQVMGHALMAGLMLVLVALQSHATTGGFDVRNASTRIVDGVFLLDADMDVAFSDEALEALNSGVALTVIVELQIVQVRNYLWDKGIAKLSARNQLKVHALSRQYVVESLNTGASKAYRTLPAALGALGILDNFPMLDEYLLEEDKSYDLRMRARLDVEALPAPLRPVAYLSSLWKQESPWSTWPIVR